MAALHRVAVAATFALTSAVPARAQWTRIDAPEVAPLRSLAASPVVPGRWLAGIESTDASVLGWPLPESGALGASGNDAGSWARLGGLDLPSAAEFAWHPTEPGVVWCLDGTSRTVHRSEDAGRTWGLVYAPATFLESIAVDPLVPDRLYAVGGSIAQDGFHRSDDGGLTWRSSYGNSWMLDVAVVPEGAPGALLVSTFSFELPMGVLRSEDGGASFTQVLALGIPDELVVAAENPRSVWAREQPSEAPARVYRSEDGGRTWAQVATPATPFGPLEDLVDLEVHPTNPRRAWAASLSAGVFRTVDGGATWTAAGALPIAVGPGVLAVSPGNPDTLFLGGSWGMGGVWRSDDAGTSWSPSSAGLYAEVPRLEFDAHGRVLGIGLGLPVWRDADASPWSVIAWEKKNAFTTGAVSVSPLSPDTIVLVSWSTSSAQPNRVFRTLDGGANWSNVSPSGATGYPLEPLTLTHGSDGVLFATSSGGNTTYRSTDDGDSWVTLPTPGVRRLTIDPSSPQVLHGAGLLGYSRSLDGGHSWTSGAPGLEGASLFGRPEVDVQDPTFVAMLADAADGSRTLFVSRDRGATWSATGAGLPRDAATALALDPRLSGRVLVGTIGEGAFLSVDHGSSFAAFDGGLEGSSVLSVAIDPAPQGSAWASTAGGGMWTARLP